MISEPINDVECLGTITEHAIAAVETQGIRDIADRFETTEELAAWLRSLPQRNDTGDASDGPRVKCDVSQRLRLPAEDPNCVERAAIYIAVAELIDPEPVRHLATIDTPIGRHTFPVEDDEPVNLDPRMTRNALDAGLFRLYEPRGLRNLSPRDALDWVLAVAEEPATETAHGARRFRNAERAFRVIEDGRARELPRNAARDIGYVLAVAHEAAQLFGDKGLNLARLGKLAVQQALSGRQRNLIGLRIGGVTIKPDLAKLGAIGRVGGRLGLRVGSELVKAKLASLGLGPEVIGAVETELRTEGLTLGTLAEPPPQPGTLAALTTSALLQKRLAESG